MISQLNKYFGAILKSKRREKGLTQDQLGDLVGTSRVCIANWERGINVPSLEKVYIICCVFQEAPTAFFPPIVLIDQDIDSPRHQTVEVTVTKVIHVKKKFNKATPK